MHISCLLGVIDLVSASRAPGAGSRSQIDRFGFSQLPGEAVVLFFTTALSVKRSSGKRRISVLLATDKHAAAAAEGRRERQALCVKRSLSLVERLNRVNRSGFVFPFAVNRLRSCIYTPGRTF